MEKRIELSRDCNRRKKILTVHIMTSILIIKTLSNHKSLVRSIIILVPEAIQAIIDYVNKEKGVSAIMGEFAKENSKSRLIIDRITPDDKEDYFNSISHDKKVLETFVCKYAESLDEFDFEPYLKNDTLYAIRLKDTGKLIGIILYFIEAGNLTEEDHACEIGYGISSSYWNKGYATEAVRAFIEYCFKELKFEKVYASFFTGNEASKKVMEKCGMHYDHFVEKEFEYLGVERDLTYYVIEK